MQRARNWSVAGAVAAVVALISCGVAQAQASLTATIPQLAPGSIVADGSSTSTVTAEVTDQTGAGVPGETVDIVAIDQARHQLSVTAPVDNHDGTYTATVTSSLVPGSVTVTPIVTSASAVSYPSVLIQNATSTAYLTAVSNGLVSATNLPVTNQSVILLATVTAAPPSVSPTGTVTITNRGAPISGCVAIPTPSTGSASLTVTCTTSFAAVEAPVALTAMFTPAGGTFVLPSVSDAGFGIDPDSTSATVMVGSPSAHVGAPVTYTALVAPTQLGPATPSGSVAFLDNGRTISTCGAQPLSALGTATCTVTYASLGAHAVTAVYSGDSSFLGASSRPSSVDVVALGTIQASMAWTFEYTPVGTRVISLRLNGVTPGMSVRVTCSGRGCPFRRHTLVAHRSHPCRIVKGRRSCPGAAPLALEQGFGQRFLRPGTVITIEIFRAGWTGKVYRFQVGRGREPLVQISCLAPGSSRPGVGC